MRGKREDRIAALEAENSPWPGRTLWTLFDDTARRHPNRDFLLFDNGQGCTYGEFAQDAERAAKAFSAIGVGKGAHVAVKAGNWHETVVTCFALARLGAVKAALNVGMGRAELGYLLEDADCDYLVTDDADDLAVAAKMARLKAVVVVEEAGKLPPAVPDAPEVLAWGDFMERAAGVSCPPCDAAPGDLVDIMFTSGSTGNPKGVPITHDRLLRTAYCNCLNRGFEDGRRICTNLPLNHCFGYVEGLVAVLFVAGALAFATGKFDAARFLGFTGASRANDILMVPYIAGKLCDEVELNPWESSDLHAVYCAGEFYSDDFRERVCRCLGVRDVINGYGMTEICGAAVQGVPLEDPQEHPGCIGPVLPAGAAGDARFGGRVIEYRVVDPDTGEALPAGEMGELCCRGLTVMDGYYGNPEATAATFSADGWLLTGDLGTLDADGYLRLEGRLGDNYRINGENVSPRFIERVVGRCPGVVQAAVVGIPDKRLGAVGALFVQMDDGGKRALDRVERFCRKNLARFQVPKYFFALDGDDWPRTASGKVRTAQLRRMAVDSLVGAK